ncbi:MAG: ABC transporter ATP-binding protein [Pseudomonadota bacterium]
MTAILDISGLHKSYGEVQVLHNVSVSIDPGEFLVLLGPSGCGKSTLLNCIAGLEEITGGTLSIAGDVVNERPPKDRDIAMVFQSYALYPNMSVAENIAFGMKIRGVPKADQSVKVDEVARVLQIEHLLDRKPSALSGGQRQRVAIGRALVRQPKLFLFDEPLSNLDARLRVEMRAEIRRLHQAVGASIVYVTHDQIEAMTLATKIVVMRDGVVQQIGSPAEVYANPANTFVAEFMGSPPMCILPGEVTGGRAEVTTMAGDVLPIPLDHPVPTGPIQVGIRPETLTLGTAGADPELTIAGTEATGADLFATIDVPGGKPLIARLPPTAAFGPGDKAPFRIDPAATRFFDAETGVAL